MSGPPDPASAPDLQSADIAAREAAHEAFVWANLKRNYLGHYLHGMMGMTGFRMFNAPTFLPAYLHELSGSNAIVGLGLGLQQLGGALSPIVGAAFVEHRPRVMPMAMWIGGLARLAVLGVALAGWFLFGQAQIAAIMVCLFLFGFLMAIQRVAFAVLMSKVIPIRRRGRLQAWRNATGGVIAAGVAYLAGRFFIEPNLLGNGYSTTFLLTFVITSFGLSAIRLLMIEPDPPTIRPRMKLGARLREFPAMLAEARFRDFLIVSMLSVAARMALPFYVIFASSTMELTGGALGLLTVAFLAADTISGLAWGYLGDHSGFRRTLLIALGLWIACTLLLMGSSGQVWMVFLAFAGLGASQAGYTMSVQTLVLELGSRNEMAMRVGVAATAEGIMAALGPLAGGLISVAFGYNVLFSLSIACLTAALAVLILKVKEPRRREA